MADIRQVSDKFAVAPQICEQDFATIAEKGFKLVINNRPDGEEFGQLTSADAESAAQAQGLQYKSIAISGTPTDDAVSAMMSTLQSTDGPIFAYCRSGTRSTVLWCIASVRLGNETPESALEKAAAAGYDLQGIAPLLAAK